MSATKNQKKIIIIYRPFKTYDFCSKGILADLEYKRLGIYISTE